MRRLAAAFLSGGGNRDSIEKRQQAAALQSLLVVVGVTGRGTLGWMKQTAFHRILDGRSDANIGFQELRRVLLSFDFEERVRGSHHIFSKAGVEELINLQREGNKAKPYQVKQVRRILVKYQLVSEESWTTNMR